MAPSQSYSFTFTAPGTYMYHCTYHPWMVASVTVKTG
jgi:plastocyanin